MKPDNLEKIYIGNPPSASSIYQYLSNQQAHKVMWYQDISIMQHIANVALFTMIISNKIIDNKQQIDLDLAWRLAWIRDIGRVPWAKMLTEKSDVNPTRYGHHGLLGYLILKKSGISEEYARISMTHIGSGIDRDEAKQINNILGKEVFPIKNWYATSLEEKVVVIADKILGWQNLIEKPYKNFLKGEKINNKIYSWIPNQTKLWQRFWNIKKEVDEACGCNSLSLFDEGLLASNRRSYIKLPKASLVVKMTPHT